MIDHIKEYTTLRNLIFFFSLIAGWPCVFYLMGWLPHYQINYIALFVACILFVLIKGEYDIPSDVRFVIFIQIGGWILFSLIHSDGSYYTRILMLVITWFILRMQYNDSDQRGFCKLYNGWLSVQVGLGTIGLILVIVGILHPFFIFREMDGRPGYFFGLFTTNTYFGILVRNAGFFDEPGALAFWGIYALLLNKLFVKNKTVEYILIVGLISTLSMAYFIQLALYLFVFYREKTSKLVISFLSIYLVLWLVASYDDVFYKAIFGRFEFDSNTGTFAGDNRSMLMERCWKIFCDNPIVGIGASKLASPEIAKQYGFVGANFFVNWAADGLIGGIITYLPLFFIWKLRSLNPTYTGVAIILLVGFLQRPYDSSQILFPLLTYTLFLNGYIDCHEDDTITNPKGFEKSN